MVSKSTHIKFPIHDHGQDTVRLLESMPSQETFDRVSDTFQLISNNTRLKILWLLCHSEECVTNIAAAIEMSAPAVSHHLRVLKQSGLIRSRRIGKETHYSLSNTQDAVLVHTIIDNFLGQ